MENIEELHYIVEDSVLAEVLGRQNFSNKESAVLELVKNAYDAGATTLNIIFQNTASGVILTISDNGNGMDADDIKNSWMHVGKSSRGYLDKQTSRVYAGSKGIGRFALSRLGQEIVMVTKKENSSCIEWNTDWEKSFLKYSSKRNLKGTEILIENLRDRWTRRSIKPLNEYLSKVYNDTEMDILLKFENQTAKVEKIWLDPQIGENYVNALTMNYNANKQKLICKFEIDEFKDFGYEISKSLQNFSYQTDIEIFNQLYSSIKSLIEDDVEKTKEYEIKVQDEEIREILTEIGDFRGKLFFSLSTIAQEDYEWFEYKYKNLLNRFRTGVILYRNAFSIDSFEGRNDWLNLSKRASRSPAAASHPTGRWRVRPNQISGYIEIDKQQNKFIEDLSNRQGIADNYHFEIMKNIILEGINKFESLRQNVIREIHEYKKGILEVELNDNDEIDNAVKIVNKLKENYDILKTMTPGEIDKVIVEFDRREKENKNIQREKKEVEEKYKYESQLLNVLATSQLKISSLGHEIRNDRNNINDTPSDLEQAIRNVIDWEELLDDDKPLYKNIPKLMTNLKKNTSKFLKLTDTILEEMEKEKFLEKEYDLEELVNIIVAKWNKQYSWIRFENIVESTEKILISYDQLMVIFDNLILNSIQKNDDKNSLTIKINIINENDFMIIEYEDNGKGLSKKYLSDPMVILEAHESSRKKGHGLGMWMVNNTINKLNGKIEKIEGENGFYLSAFIKTKSRRLL